MGNCRTHYWWESKADNIAFPPFNPICQQHLIDHLINTENIFHKTQNNFIMKTLIQYATFRMFYSDEYLK